MLVIINIFIVFVVVVAAAVVVVVVFQRTAAVVILPWNRITGTVVSTCSGNRPFAAVAILSSSTDQFIYAYIGPVNRFLVVVYSGSVG